jgi:hypothetical protein
VDYGYWKNKIEIIFENIKFLKIFFYRLVTVAIFILYNRVISAPAFAAVSFALALYQ